MNYDLETAIEDAITTLLKGFTDVKVVRWDNFEEKHLGPVGTSSDVIKVKATSIGEEPGTLNLFAGETIQVDIAAFSTKKRDGSSRSANKQRGKIREFLAESDIVTQINSFGTICVYSQGVIPISSFEASDDKNWGKGVTVTVVARPI